MFPWLPVDCNPAQRNWISNELVKSIKPNQASNDDDDRASVLVVEHDALWHQVPCTVHAFMLQCLGSTIIVIFITWRISQHDS